MVDKIRIMDLIIPNNLRGKELHLETFVNLGQKPVDEWEPISVQGNRLIDGMQRVIAARAFGHSEIPCKRIK